MDFEIYALGDTQMYWDILNGIAMLFSSSDLVSGTNGMNLSFGAFFGAMILLCVMLYKSVMNREIDIRSMLMPLFIYMILTVPKADIVIIDIYNVDAPKVVDNIPIGLALPASAVSGFSLILTKVLELSLTVIPVSSGQYDLPKMTEQGFLTPLQVLNQIRYDNVSSAYPSFQQALTELYSSCLINNSAFSPQAYERSPDATTYLLDAARQANGMVTFYVNQAGESVPKTETCSATADVLKNSLESYMNGTVDINGLIYQPFRKNSFSERLAKRISATNTYGKLNSVNGVNAYTPDQIVAMVGHATGLSSDESRNFMSSILLNPMVKTAGKCVEEYSAFALSQCTGWVTANEQWKQQGAMSGTSFLKNIKNGQNILVLVGFMLFPVMVFLLMIQGMGSMKLIGGYIGFMVSNYLWIPIATIINFYAQYEFQEALFAIKSMDPSASLTLTQAPQLYDALTEKLTIANNALGLVPVLTTMFFGGMMYGMTAISNAINPASQGYDAKINSKSAESSASIGSSSAVISKTGFSPTETMGVGNVNSKVSQAMAAASSKTISLNDQESVAMSRLQSLADKASNVEKMTVSERKGHTSGSTTGTQEVSRIGSSEDTTIATSNTHDTKTDKVSKEKTETVGEKKATSDTYSGDLSIDAAGRYTVNKGSKNEKGAGISIGGSLAAATNNNKQLSIGESNVGPDSKNPTEKSSTSEIDNLHLKNADSSTYQGSNAKYKTSSNSSSDFKAQQWNEIIQADRTGTLSTAEKQEASNLVSQVKKINEERSETLSSVMSNAISDRDISGMLNPLSGRSDAVREGLALTDKMGQERIQNWETLKQMGLENARKGGHHDQETMNSIAIFYAASLGNDTDTKIQAITSVSGVAVGNNFSNNREMFAVPNAEATQQKLKHDMGQFDSIDNNHLVNESKKLGLLAPNQTAELINGSQADTARAKGLMHQKLDGIKHVNTDGMVVLDHGKNAKEVTDFYASAKVDTSSRAPKLTDENGNLIFHKVTPQNGLAFEAPIDKQITEASDAGDEKKVAELLTKQNNALTGRTTIETADRIIEAAKKRAEDNLPSVNGGGAK